MRRSSFLSCRLLLLTLATVLAACGPLQPASGPPTYNRDIGDHGGA
jgi:hypothetical protein